MIQQVTIKSAGQEDLKPLVRAAIRGELKLLAHGIKRTRAKLAEFEKRFGMSSEEFERKFKAIEISETLENLDWWMELEALHLLEQQHQTLTEAQID